MNVLGISAYFHDAAAALVDFFVFTTEARDDYAALVASMASNSTASTCIAMVEVSDPVAVASPANCAQGSVSVTSGGSAATVAVLPLLATAAACWYGLRARR